MLAMAATHSFDVTWGVPLARLSHPSEVSYVYLNQSVQLVLVNPLLLVLMELNTSSTGSLRSRLKGIILNGVLKNPLVSLLGQAFGLHFYADGPCASHALVPHMPL